MNPTTPILSLIHPDVFELNDFIPEQSLFRPVYRPTTPVELSDWVNAPPSSPIELPEVLPVLAQPETVEEDMSWVKPIMTVEEIELKRANAIAMRDRYVECINNLSIYRVLTHQYIPITRNTIEDIEWIKIIEQGYKVNTIFSDKLERGIDTQEDYEYLLDKYHIKQIY